jgi:hypothetical protein
MGAEITGIEGRLRRLEEEILRLQKRLASDEHKLNQVAEDQARQFQPERFGDIFFRCQSVGVIPAAVPPAIASGTVRLLQLIGSTRYKLQPIAMGDITIGAVNDTGSATINNEYLIGAYIGGVATLLVGDCVTTAPAIAPDPPTG